MEQLLDTYTCDAALIIDSSEQNMDLYYLTRFFAPDSFAALFTATQSAVIVSDLEYERARKEAQVDTVLRQNELLKNETHKHDKISGQIKAVICALEQFDVKTILVPAAFPIAYADILRERGYVLIVAKGTLAPERLHKTDSELSYIQRAVTETETVVKHALAMIASADIQDEKLYLDGELLTSERVKSFIMGALIERGYLPLYTIVASGEQGCDPHNQGSGPLYANTPIIMDVFPRSLSSFYFADMTRTIVRGTPDPYVIKMFDAVLNAQDAALNMIRDGVSARSVHQAVCDVFEREGFRTGTIDGIVQGFIHSTGHGVGLEIHEHPRIASIDDTLHEGHVVTVEPGLYYRGYGGIRLEDLVVVTQNGCTNLNTLPKQLVIVD